MRYRVILPGLVLKNKVTSVSIAVLFLATFLVFLPLLCSRLTYSKYYHWMVSTPTTELQKRAQNANEYRTLLATYYLSQLNASKTLSYFQNQQKKTAIEIAVGIVTVRRQHNSQLLGYLTQVVSKTIQIFYTDKAFSDKVLFICNTFSGPGFHVEANQLAKYVPVYNRFPPNTRKERNFDRFEKEKEDYNYCLHQALKYQPKYVIIIEDDAVPRPDFFIILRHVLDNSVEKKLRVGERISNYAPWAYLKLYYPERWQGFSYEPQQLMELCGIAFIGGIIFLCLFQSCAGKREVGALSVPCLSIFLLGVVYFILVALLVGRQYLVSLRRMSQYLYTVGPAPDCCSPGILYSRQMATELLEYLSGIKCSSNFPIDFAMDKFATSRNYQRYLVEPNLLTHIGMFSSIRLNGKRPEEFIF